MRKHSDLYDYCISLSLTFKKNVLPHSVRVCRGVVVGDEWCFRSGRQSAGKGKIGNKIITLHNKMLFSGSKGFKIGGK